METFLRPLGPLQIGQAPPLSADTLLVIALDQQRNIQPRRAGVAAVAAAGAWHA